MRLCTARCTLRYVPLHCVALHTYYFPEVLPRFGFGGQPCSLKYKHVLLLYNCHQNFFNFRESVALNPRFADVVFCPDSPVFR